MRYDNLVIDLDELEVTSSEYPKWVNRNLWDVVKTDDDYYHFVNKNTGKIMTNFQNYLLCGIYETHRNRDGQHRPSSWDEYEYAFLAVAMVSDYSGTSYSKRAIFECLKQDLESKYPKTWDETTHDSNNDWTIFYWQYNGEQVLLRVIDNNQEPTPVAEWFFFTANYHSMLEEISELEDKFDSYSVDNFFKEYAAAKGQGPTYTVIDAETHQPIFHAENYQGERNSPEPQSFKLMAENFQSKYKEIILESFKQSVDDSSVWNYKSYLVEGWNSEYNLNNLWQFLQDNNMVEIRDYTSEIVFTGDPFTVPHALQQLGLIELAPDDIDSAYDSEFYVGEWGLHVFKILDLIGSARKELFIAYVNENYHKLNVPGSMSYARRTFIEIKTIYENFLAETFNEV